MTRRRPAFRSASALALLLVCTPGTAFARTTAGSASSDAVRQEIAAMRAQMAAMAARIDTLESQIAVARTAAADAQAQSVQAQAQSVQAQAQSANAVQVATTASAAAAAAPARAAKLPEWVANTTIGGKAFMNVSTIRQKSNGADVSTKGTQAELKRFYLSVDHKFDDTFSANLTTDVRYGTNGLANDDVLYVKKAYLQAKFSPALWVRLGAADLPWVPYSEGIYNYRWVEQVQVDRLKYGTSSDWGIHIGGVFANGLVGYQVSAVGGQGYKTISRSTDTIDIEGRIDVHPVAGVTLALGGYTGKLGKSTANAAAVVRHTATRLNALAAYTAGPIRIGVEYFSARNWNNVTTVASDRTDGWSVFGSYALDKRFTVFGRYDRTDPNKYTSPNARESYFNLGLNYAAVKGVDIALVYKRDSVDAITLVTGNGTIGGSTNGTYDEVGVWTQLKF